MATELSISEILAAVVYYAFLFVGSITIGYLFLRLMHPEVRTLPRKQKTRNAFLAGAGFLTIAIAVDAVLNGFENVARVNSFTPLIASLLAGFTFVIFNLASSLKTRPLIVGVILPHGKERVARGLAYVEEVVVKTAPPLVTRELPTETKPVAPATGPAAPSGPAAPRSGKSVHEKLEELKRTGVIRIEKPVVEKPALEKPKLEKPLTMPTPAAVATAPTATIPAGAPAVATPAKKGFFAWLFGGKQKPKQVSPVTSRPAPRAVAPVKKEEAEIEVIIKELGLVKEKPAAARGTGARAAEIATAPPGGERHRLYLRVKEEKAERVGAEKVSEAVRERTEVNEFVKDVYTKLKAEQKPEGLREKVGVRQPKKELERERGKKVKVEEKPLSLSDLLGIEKPTEAPTPAAAGASAAAPVGGLFAELEALTSGKKEEAKLEKKEEKREKEGEMTFIKMRTPGDIGCPTCHSKNTRIIFCPYCGTGLCANCATSIKTTLDAFIYTCPKCGEEITVKRKAAAATAAALG